MDKGIFTQEEFERRAKFQLERVKFDRRYSRYNQGVMRFYRLFSAIAKKEGIDTSTYDIEAEIVNKEIREWEGGMRN
ncbi:MAG: hypothetical protein PVJ67_00920 [Candidatus Pacearchaeota archaeon]|jgi:hypothetical protein